MIEEGKNSEHRIPGKSVIRTHLLQIKKPGLLATFLSHHGVAIRKLHDKREQND